jgi:hypothetical protein
MRKKQNVSFLSCWHMAKVGKRDGGTGRPGRDQPQRDGYNEGTFKVFRLARGGVNPQES